MNSANPDYYQMLGLASTATPDEIKKRYRELARRYHPDVNPDPAASQQIKAVNEAYHTLNDPDRRALYDAHRILDQSAATRSSSGSNRPAAPPRGASSPGPTPPPRPQASRPTDGPRTAGTGSSRPYTGERAGYNGFGRTAPDDSRTDPPPRSASNAQQSARRPESREKTPPPVTTVNSLLSEAQLAFVNRRYREAEMLCKQALAMDRRHAVVYELLGDIYARKGQTESATTAYSYAIQFNPRNYSIHGKLERMMGRHEVHEAGPTMTRPVAVPRPAWGGLTDAHRALSLNLFSFGLLLAFAGFLVWFHAYPGEAFAAGLPWLTMLSPSLILTALLDGLFAGILLAFYGGMRPVSEELVRHESPQKGTQPRRSSPISLVVLLGLFSLVFFYLSAAVYVGIGLIYGKISRSLLRAYLTAGVLVGLFSYVASLANVRGDYTLWVAAFAGNVLFPAILVGWAIGDSIRLRGRRA